MRGAPDIDIQLQKHKKKTVRELRLPLLSFTVGPGAVWQELGVAEGRGIGAALELKLVRATSGAQV